MVASSLQIPHLQFHLPSRTTSKVMKRHTLEIWLQTFLRSSRHTNTFSKHFLLYPFFNSEIGYSVNSYVARMDRSICINNNIDGNLQGFSRASSEPEIFAWQNVLNVRNPLFFKFIMHHYLSSLNWNGTPMGRNLNKTILEHPNATFVKNPKFKREFQETIQVICGR